MPDVLRKGFEWLEGKRRAHMTVEVVYARGEHTVTLSATVGKTQFEQTDDYGIIRRSESRDFLITADDLVLDSVKVEPLPGDRILDRIGDAWHIFQVGAPNGEPPFRVADPGRLALRVHTFHVGQEPAE